MPRLARLVLPGLPHHVTQRGNRRQPTFFSDADYALYLKLLRFWCGQAGTAVWAWCLMPNHVHLVLVPSRSEGLSAALAQTHRRYTRAINGREGWIGYLWQNRFASFPMDEAHLYACLRYVELNPVRAGLVARPEEWRWSSARAHLGLGPDGITDLAAMRGRIDDWRGLSTPVWTSATATRSESASAAVANGQMHNWGHMQVCVPKAPWEINQREDWRGHLWQSRFASFPMSEAHLYACLRYVELNPVRAGLVTRPEEWRWSSARTHLELAQDGLTDMGPARERIADWQAFLSAGLADDDHKAIRDAERTGRLRI